MNIGIDPSLQGEKGGDTLEVVQEVEIGHVLGSIDIDIEDIDPETVEIKLFYYYILFYFILLLYLLYFYFIIIIIFYIFFLFFYTYFYLSYLIYFNKSQAGLLVYAVLQ